MFSLYQARVGQYLGTLTMEDMLEVFTVSRKAQNFFHYTAMRSVPGFNELTTRYSKLNLIKKLNYFNKTN